MGHRLSLNMIALLSKPAWTNGLRYNLKPLSNMKFIGLKANKTLRRVCLLKKAKKINI